MKHFFDSFKVLVAFTGHVVTGVLLFVGVAAAALLVHWVAGIAAALGVAPLILKGLAALEYLLFAADFIVTVTWVVISTKKAILDLLED